MTAMPRPRPPYLSREITRHGKPVWYVRRGGRRIRLRADFGTPEFDAEYQAACSGIRPQKAEEVAGTLGWLITRYRETDAWQSFSLATRQRRESILKQVLTTSGDKPISRITTVAIVAGRDRRKPFQAVHFLQTMRGLFRWAVKSKIIRTDPTADVEDPVLKIKGFPIWSEEAVAAYEARWPIGTRQRVWLGVLLYTGLRRGDAVTTRPPERTQGCRHAQDRENRYRGDTSDFAGVSRNVGRGTVRRPNLYYRRRWSASTKGVLRKCLQACLPCCRLAWLVGAWAAKGSRHTRR